MTPDSTAEARSAGRGIIPPRAAFWCALCVWVLTLAATAAALIYNQVHPLPAGVRDLHWNAAAGVAAAAVTVGFATVGALLAWKRPANPIGWPLCATGLSYAAAGSGLVLLHIPAARDWGHWLGWLFFFGFGFVVFVVLLFPTGSLPSRRWRPGINKTLVYGSLAVFITAVYVAIVVGVGSLAQRGARPSLAPSIAATAVVAIAFQPVRAWVQRLANRLVYGRRATPYQVLADFADRMAGAYAAEDLLPRMARILAEGTAATRADIWLKSGEMFHDGAM